MRMLLPAFAALVVIPPAAPIREFRIDAGHSDVAFSIGFLGHPVRGRFDDIHGTIIYAAGNATASAVTVVIGVKSIATGSTHRDDHLRSSDFFDADKYPVIVFRSTTIVPRKDSLVANGMLTLHGVTRAVSIPFRETSAPIADPHGSTLILFSGQLRIARKDFGIMGGSKFNDWFDDLRSATMADSVDITLDVTGWDGDADRNHRYDPTVQRIEHDGIASVLATLRKRRAEHPDSLAGADRDIEQIALVLRAHGRNADALSLLQFNAETFDRNAAVHTALARAFELSGNLDSAKAHTLVALSLDSLDTRALELSRRLGELRSGGGPSRRYPNPRASTPARHRLAIGAPAPPPECR